MQLLYFIHQIYIFCKTEEFTTHFVKKGEYFCNKQIEFMNPLFEQFSVRKKLYIDYFKENDFIYLKKGEKFAGGVFIQENFRSFATKEKFILETNKEYRKGNLKLKSIKNFPSNYKKQILIFCLFVEKEFRNQGLSSVLLNAVYDRYKPDIFSLGVSPKDKMSPVNFYNYFKGNFVYITPNDSVLSKIFHLTEEEFLNLKIDNPEDLKNLQTKVDLFCVNDYKKKNHIYHLVMTCIDYKKINRISKKELFKSGEEFLRTMGYSY